MKRIFLLTFIILSITTIVLSQSCLPDGITFTNQIQIDSFQTNYPNCTEIEGNVTFALGAHIENLNGLNILTSIGGGLFLSEYEPMTNFIGLENLTSIGGSLVMGNTIDAGSCTVTAFTGLENLNSIGGNLEVYDTHNLLNFSGLNNLTSVHGNIKIGAGSWGSNYGLISLDGLENIEASSISNISIGSNPNLTICSIKSICDYISDPNGTIYFYNNAQGCNSITEVVEGCETIGISDISCKNEFSIYPNPAKLEINISTKNRRNIKEVNIYNQIGQIVLQRNQIIEKVDISVLGQGIYIIELSTGELKIREKLIIER